jgi:hypothetical protein
MWDLTIQNDHDFYIDIDIATTAILVHNCNGYEPSGEAANYTRDELAQLTYQHVGEGDIPGRPTLEEIQQTLNVGEVTPITGQNAARIEYQGVRVIINEDNPLRSTAYYPGQ